MTNEEAAKKMHWQKIEWLEIINNGQDEVVEAYDKAIKALESKSEAEEYRKPKKVKRYTTHCNGKDFTYKVDCPFCDKSLRGECFDKKAPYCIWCGQALDWD